MLMPPEFTPDILTKMGALDTLSKSELIQAGERLQFLISAFEKMLETRKAERAALGEQIALTSNQPGLGEFGSTFGQLTAQADQQIASMEAAIDALRKHHLIILNKIMGNSAAKPERLQ